MVPTRNDEADPNHPIHAFRRQSDTRRRIRDPNQRHAIISHYNSSHPSNIYYQAQQYPHMEPRQPYLQPMPVPGPSPFQGLMPPHGRIIAQYQQQPHPELQVPQYNDTNYVQSNRRDQYIMQQAFANPPFNDGSSHCDGSYENPMQQGSFGGDITLFQQDSHSVMEASNGLSGDDMFQPPSFESAPPFLRPPLTNRQPTGIYSLSQQQPPFAQSAPVHQPFHPHNDDYSFEPAWGEPVVHPLQQDSFEQACQEQRRAPSQAHQDNGVAIDHEAHCQEAAPSQFATGAAGLKLPPRGDSHDIGLNLHALEFFGNFSPHQPQNRQQMLCDASSIHQPPFAHERHPNLRGEHDQHLRMQTGLHGAEGTEAARGISCFQKSRPDPPPPPFGRQFSAAVRADGSNDFQPHVGVSIDRVENRMPDIFNHSHQRQLQRWTVPVPETAEISAMGQEERSFHFQTWKGSKADRRPATEPPRLSVAKVPKPFSNRTNQQLEQNHHHSSRNDLADDSKHGSSTTPHEAAHFHDEFHREERKQYPSVHNLGLYTQSHSVRFFNEGAEVDLENRPLPHPRSPGYGTNPYLRGGGGIAAAQTPAPPPIQIYARRAMDNDSDDDLDLAGKTSLWGGKKR
jgi:hypothetical protein